MRLRNARCLAAGLFAVLAAPAWSQAGPSLTAAAHQRRERSQERFSVVPLWDTTWWITVEGRRGSVPLQGVEYQARFTDGADTRARTGTFEISGADRDAVRGRINVTCPTRPDYLRPLRVRLRLRDANGVQGDWLDLMFPVKGEGTVTGAATAASAAPPITTQPDMEQRHEILGTVQVEVDSGTTIAEVRAQLQQKAHAQGGDAASGFRLLSSVGEQSTFAADVIRYVEPTPAPSPTGASAAAPGERILGEIAVAGTR